MNEWRVIINFPNYSVSNLGFVRNDETGRIMSMLVNQHGVVNVGLTKNRVQYKRAVSRLVAEAFLVPPRRETFDTPINLDGDRFNNHEENLLWRPRWFAVKYFKQFEHGPIKPIISVEETNTHEKFTSSWEAAITYGLIERDIRVSTTVETEVWPTYQRFRVI